MEYSQCRLTTPLRSSAGTGDRSSRYPASGRRIPRLSLLGFLVWGASVPSAMAQGSPITQQRTPVFVWGIQEGCKLKPDITAQVMDRLAKEHSYRVEPLLPLTGNALPACPGPAFSSSLGCSDALKHECSGEQGLILGGVVDHQNQATRIRLWLYNLQTKKLAVQDDYCQQCDPDDSKVVASQAAAILSAPDYDNTPLSQPSYCQSSRSVGSATPMSAGSLHLGVFGSNPAREDFRKELLRRMGLKRAAQQQSAPLVTEQRGADPTSLESITKGQNGAQVLRIEIGTKTAELSLWDQGSRRVATRSVACGDGCRDVLEALSQAAAEILDVCFADRCSLVQPVDHRPPDACLELNKQECPALPGTVASGAKGGVDRGIANRLEVLTGVGLGLSVATTVGLWVANETVTVSRTAIGTAGKYEGTKVTGTYPADWSVPSGIATGLTAGLALLSIPIFYSLEKAKRVPPGATDLTKSLVPAGSISCPAPLGIPSAGLPRRSRL